MPIGIFLFSLKSEFQKSEENGEKRRKPEKISGFSVGIFFVNTCWVRRWDFSLPFLKHSRSVSQFKIYLDNRE